MNRSSKLTLAIALALGSSNALALGLGNIEVRSGLNEPLVADIPIVESDSGEGADLRANLASVDDFKRVGLDVSAVTVPLSFEVLKDRDGRPYLHVTSDDPVREPFLSFLVEVSWGRGRLLREYNVLLDPPAVAPAVIGSNTVVEALPEPELAPAQPLEPAVETPVAEAPAAEPAVEPLTEPVTEPVAEEPAPVEPVAEPIESTPPPVEPVESVVEAPVEPEPEPMVSEPAQPEPEAAPVMETPVEPMAEQPASVAPSEYGPVAAGETLWDIASSTRHDAVSMNQMMLAILRANPDAFIDSNVNYLRRGAVLRIPSNEEAQAIAAAEAAAEVAAQMDSWRASRTPTYIADAGNAGNATNASSGDDSASDPRLALVPPREGSGSDSGLDRPGRPGGTDTSGLRNDLARTQEQLASRDQEVTELRSRVSELENLRSQSDRLIDLKDNEIAALQQRLRDAEAKAAEERAARDAAQAAADRDAMAAAVTEASPTTTDIATTEVAPTATTETASATTAPDTSATTTATDAASTDPLAEQIAAEAASGPDTTSTTTDTDIPATETAAEVTPVPETAPVADAPAETPAATATESSSDAVTSSERPPLPWYRNTKILIGGSAGLIVLGALLALMGRRKVKPVDDDAPRSSVADQFAGGVFGARASASGDSEEGALLERLAADPTDLDTHLDLLRLYHHSADVDKFESAANAMYAQVGDTSHPAWQQAMTLGAEMLPDSPMFQAQDFGAGDSAFDLSSEPPAAPAPSPVSAAVKPGDSGLFDFDVGRKPAPASTPAPAKSTAADFDFSLDVPEVKKPSAADVGATAKINKPEAQNFTTQEFKAPDFDLDLSKPEPAKMTAKPAPAPAAPAAPAAPDNFFEGEDAVGTKLDLARAYLDMGDPEGARSMLQEVLGEGTDAQKSEARKLLSEIG